MRTISVSYTHLIDEIVGNEKVVQAFNHEDEALEQFDEINDRLQKCSLSFSGISALNSFVSSIALDTVSYTHLLSCLNEAL